MNTKWIVGIVAAAVLLAGGYALTRQSADSQTASKQESAAMKSEEGAPMEKPEDKMAPTGTMVEDKNMEDRGQAVQNRPGAYEDYSPAALAAAVNNGGKAVLFFWAAWCPYCKEANTDFINNIGQIPAGVTVLKTNYDTEKDLKTKYGVTYQHTFVQVDSQGKQVAKWNGGAVEELNNKIK